MKKLQLICGILVVAVGICAWAGVLELNSLSTGLYVVGAGLMMISTGLEESK